MSVLPKNTQNKNFCRTSVLDRSFMLKHKLSYTQTLIMGYFVMIMQSWKNLIFVDEDYFVLVSHKITSDLVIGSKTLEASITQLKKKGLIETKLTKVSQWKSNENFRAVQISKEGLKYSLSHFKPDIMAEMEELKRRNRELEFQNKVLTIQLEAEESFQKAKEDLAEEERAIREQKIKAEKEAEKKAEIAEKEASETNSTPPKEFPEESEKEFKKRITKEYWREGEPICNCVKNKTKWINDATFYINTYHQLSVKLPNEPLKQIANPITVKRFWSWLYRNKHRVGQLLDTTQPVNTKPLLKFIGKKMTINCKKYTIESIHGVVGGVEIILEDVMRQTIIVNNGEGEKVIDVLVFKRWMESLEKENVPN